jgi:hypothetical protein
MNRMKLIGSDWMSQSVITESEIFMYQSNEHFGMLLFTV